MGGRCRVSVELSLLISPGLALLILIIANASADVSGDMTSDLAFKNCLFFFKIQLRTPQDIANELLKP